MKTKDCPKCEMENFSKIQAGRIRYINLIQSKNRPKLTAYLKTIGKHYAGVYVKSKCYECVGWEDVIDSVQDCRGYGCPLYFKRPYCYKDTDDVRKKILVWQNKTFPVAKKQGSQASNFKSLKKGD
jgi:hypothetical protein